MGINFKQRIFSEWIIYCLLLIISFVTLIVSYSLFLACDCCKYTKFTIQFLLIVTIISILIYFVNLSKKINTTDIIEFFTRFNFLKNVFIVILLICFVLLSKVVYYSGIDCKENVTSDPHVCKLTCNHPDTNKRDTVIVVTSSCNHSEIKIPAIHPILNCKHQIINNQTNDTLQFKKLIQLIENNKIVYDSLFLKLINTKNCSIIHTSTVNNSSNYSIKKLKIKNKKSSIEVKDSIMFDPNFNNFNSDKFIIKNKKSIIQ